MPTLVRKQHFMLLEILIALTLIILCMLPLIAPHVKYYEEQKKFSTTLATSRTINLLHADLIERLHRNEIAWNTIQEGISIPLNDQLDRLEIKNFPYKGTCRFVKEISKKNAEWGVHHFHLLYSLDPIESKNHKPIQLSYDICLLRHAPQSIEEQETEEEETDDVEETNEGDDQDSSSEEEEDDE